MDWQTELIPDSASLFRRVHRSLLRGDEVTTGAFQNSKGESGMSVDWAAYSSAEESRNRAKNPSDNAIIRLVAGQVRQVPNQSVQHSPIDANRSHTTVEGEKTPRVRLALQRISSLVIPIEPPARSEST